jgi:crotonobetainyl-CoA:carnitine CoA-transferase CaiB-like acyl-CoA transferase
MSAGNGGGALAGLRVLDIATLASAPQVAAILADLGADVIKVESPQGDPLRRIGAQRNGGSITWASVNRNKRGITLDLKQADGQELLRRLAGAVDVLVTNQPPETLSRWGCTYDQLAEHNPRLVMVSVSAYGTDGPYAGRPGAGTLAEAFGGLTHMTGEADGPPMLPSIPLGDTLCALSGVIGAVSACYHRDTGGGRGQHVDVSMYEPVLQLLGSTIAAYDPEGTVPTRTGSRVPGGVPRNVYRTADGQWIVLSGTTDAQVARILTLLGEDTADMLARFGRSESRLAHSDQLDEMVARWVADEPRDQALKLLLDARIPAAPVNDVPAILSDPHVVARRNVVDVRDDCLGSVALVGPVPQLSATPGAIYSTGPGLGAHNREVYGDLLGLSDTDLEGLARQGIV